MRLLFIILFFTYSNVSFSQDPDFIVLFDFNKSTLNETQKQNLNHWVNSYEKIKSFKIIGHCDSIGDYQYNLELSKKRAKNINQLIKKYSNSAAKFEYKSFTSPTKTNKTEFGRSLNRRVEIFVVLEKSNCRIFSTKNDTIHANLIDIENRQKEIKILSQNTFDAENIKTIAIHQKDHIPTTINITNNECPIRLSQIKSNTRFTLNNTFFKPNTPIFLPESYIELSNLFESLKENPSVKIKLEGHTNGVKTKKDPKWHYYMSTERAKAVKTYLVKKGIDSNRIDFEGFGCDKMVNPEGSTPEERRANRRVEVLITDSK